MSHSVPPSAVPFADLSDADLAALRKRLETEYAELKARGLKLDLTRGKPSAQQLSLIHI